MQLNLPVALIVDDNEGVRLIGAAHLRVLGYDTRVADSVRMAMKLLNEGLLEGLGVALVDHNLGDGFGTDVARQLRELSGDKVIISISDRFSPEEPGVRKEDLELFDVFLGKPFTGEELRNAIHRPRSP